MKIKLPKLNIPKSAVFLAAILILMVSNVLILYSIAGNKNLPGGSVNKPAKVKAIIIKAEDCEECFSSASLIAPFKNSANLEFISEKELSSGSREAQDLVKKYGISRAPVILLEGEILRALTLVPALGGYGRDLGKSAFLIDKAPPPYVDLATGEKKGIFKITYISDKNCKECYSALAHRNALASLGMKPQEETQLDRTDAEAKSLITKYKIDSLPAVLLFGDLDAYTAFLQVWPPVGSREEDGVYVFRKTGQALMGNYLDLKTDKVVLAKTNSDFTEK